MKNYKFKINGNQYEVEVLDVDRTMAKIEVNGTLYNVELELEIPKFKAASSVSRARPVKEVKPAAVAATAGAGPGTGSSAGEPLEIRAPLPGIIIQVLVRPGDDVRTGQTLCTLETMKMENAIKADKDGKVTSVNVSPAQTVNQDEVLIVMSV
jgi:biotin carboxyl carrier protein